MTTKNILKIIKFETKCKNISEVSKKLCKKEIDLANLTPLALAILARDNGGVDSEILNDFIDSEINQSVVDECEAPKQLFRGGVNLTHLMAYLIKPCGNKFIIEMTLRDGHVHNKVVDNAGAIEFEKKLFQAGFL